MFDLILLVKTAGYLGLGAMIFSESGLFVGFFLPGDTLLFTAGFLASQGFLNIWILAIVAFVCAVAGDSFGYWFGNKTGEKIFSGKYSRFLKEEYIEKTKVFFAKHGPKAILFARFIPIVRTFTPIFAGVGQMKYKTFFTYNLIGGFFWAVGLSFLGYYLGNTVPNVDHYLLPIIIIIVAISFLPYVFHFLKKKNK